MRSSAVHVTTLGSDWWFDEANKEYLRMPLGATPRERPEWGDARAGALQDGTWLPYYSWGVGSDSVLRISGPAGGVQAPNARLPVAA